MLQGNLSLYGLHRLSSMTFKPIVSSSPYVVLINQIVHRDHYTEPISGYINFLFLVISDSYFWLYQIPLYQFPMLYQILFYQIPLYHFPLFTFHVWPVSSFPFYHIPLYLIPLYQLPLSRYIRFRYN